MALEWTDSEGGYSSTVSVGEIDVHAHSWGKWWIDTDCECEGYGGTADRLAEGEASDLATAKQAATEALRAIALGILEAVGDDECGSPFPGHSAQSVAPCALPRGHSGEHVSVTAEDGCTPWKWSKS